MEIDLYKKKTWVPKHFMTVYENNESELFMEIGDILKTPKGYIVGAAQSVDEDFLSELVALVKTQNFRVLSFKGLLPSNVLHYKQTGHDPEILWYRSPEIRNLYFNDEIGIASGDYQMPHMLFHLKEEKLRVYITKSIPQMDSELFCVPLPNIHDGDDVCLGYAKLKKPTCLEEVINNYEAMFYKTEFNALHNQNFIPKDIPYIELMKNTNLCEFPLTPAKTKTLSKLIAKK